MNKTICFLVMVLILAVSVSAANSRIMVLKLNYDRGNITLLNKTIKYGFFPDRRYQPDYGYRAEIISFDDNLLYEFRFKAPNVIFVDGTNEEGQLSGGKIVLDNVNFALALSYYKNMKEINIYSPKEELVGKISFKEERKIEMIKWIITAIIGLVTLILILFIIVKNKKESS